MSEHDDDDSFEDFEDDEFDDDAEGESEGSSLRLIAIVVPILLVVLVVGFIGLSFGGRNTTAEVVAPPRPPNPADLNPLEESALSVPVPFGRKARNECALTCYSSKVDRELCLRGCNRLVVGEFARRIAADEPDPEKLSQRVTADCKAHADKSSRMQSAETWRGSAAEARRTLNEFRAAVDLYESSSLLPRFAVLELIEKSLGRPEGLGKNAEAYAAGIQTQVCVRQVLVATQLAIVHAASSRDLYSEKFYRALEVGLLEQNGQLETSLKSLEEKLQ